MVSKKLGGNDKWLVVYHKTSGRQKFLSHKHVIENQFLRANADFKLVEISYSDGLEMPNLNELKKEYGYTKVLVAGGDGALRRVVEALWKQSLLDTPVAFYPLGTASLAARILRQQPKDEHLRKILINPERVEWHLNLLNGEHIFMIAACFGRMAAFTTRTTTGLKRKFGFLAYVITGTRLGYKFPRIPAKIQVDSKEYDYPNAHSLLFFGFRAAKRLLPFGVQTRDPIQLTIATHPNPFALIKSAIEVMRAPEAPSHVELVGLKTVKMSGNFGSKIHVDGDQLKLNTTMHTIEALQEKVTLLV